MPDKADQVARKISEEYGRLFKAFGVKPTMMDVYLAIFFSEEPVSLKEIAEKTGYGTTTIANTMPIIERIFDVKSFKKPKSKKIYYECKHDTLEIFMKKTRYQLESTKNVVHLLRECEDELTGEKHPKAVRYRGYITKLREDY
ncbi:hypothetical protein KKD84_05480, partial [Patescibacteria group bacterium]|nr:hypothetical protein [Patescibacteria group bacterium]